MSRCGSSRRSHARDEAGYAGPTARAGFGGHGRLRKPEFGGERRASASGLLWAAPPRRITAGGSPTGRSSREGFLRRAQDSGFDLAEPARADTAEPGRPAVRAHAAVHATQARLTSGAIDIEGGRRQLFCTGGLARGRTRGAPSRPRRAAHERRLGSDFATSATGRPGGWVVCRVVRVDAGLRLGKLESPHRRGRGCR